MRAVKNPERPQDLKDESCATMPPVSRLRRLFLAGKIFFVTCNVLRTHAAFGEQEFALLAGVFGRVRRRRGFLLTGYVFMPDHWHGLIFPAPSDTLPRIMGSLKIASNRAVNRQRQRVHRRPRSPGPAHGPPAGRGGRQPARAHPTDGSRPARRWNSACFRACSWITTSTTQGNMMSLGFPTSAGERSADKAGVPSSRRDTSVWPLRPTPPTG